MVDSMARTRELLKLWSSNDQATSPKVLVFPVVLNSVSHYGAQGPSTSSQGVLTRKDGHKLTNTMASSDFQLFWATLRCEGTSTATHSGDSVAHAGRRTHPILANQERRRLTLSRCSLVSDGEFRERMDAWEVEDHEVVSQMPMERTTPDEVSSIYCFVPPNLNYRPLTPLVCRDRPPGYPVGP